MKLRFNIYIYIYTILETRRGKCEAIFDIERIKVAKGEERGVARGIKIPRGGKSLGREVGKWEIGEHFLTEGGGGRCIPFAAARFRAKITGYNFDPQW